MTTCQVCGGALPAQRGPRARRYCSRACQAKAYRARQQQEQTQRLAPGKEGELLKEYAGVPATELADRLAAAARRLAEALSAEQLPDASDLGVVAQIPVVLTARARKAVSPVAVVDQATAAAPAPSEVQAPPTEPSRDDSPPAFPPDRQAPKRTRPALRKRLSQKAARAVADSARLVKDADHRDTHRWNLIAEDGTVLGHVEPSYGGTGRAGRNGWNYRLTESFAVSGPYKTRKEAALQCAMAWIRVVTAPVRRTLTVD